MPELLTAGKIATLTSRSDHCPPRTRRDGYRVRDVAIGVNIIDVLAAIGSPIAIQRAARDRRCALGKADEVVIDPAGARTNIELVNMAVGGDEVDVLTVVAAPIAVKLAACGGQSSVGEDGQVVIHPARAGMNVQFVHLAIALDEVDVLAAVAAPISVKPAAGCSR